MNISFKNHLNDKKLFLCFNYYDNLNLRLTIVDSRREKNYYIEPNPTFRDREHNDKIILSYCISVIDNTYLTR